MTEDTVGDAARAVNQSFVIQVGLPGIPRGLYCRAIDVQQHMHWSPKTWRLWRDSGLKTDYPGTDAEHVWTDDLIDFLRNYQKPTAAKKKGK